jgi:hypothetical protein
MTWRYSDASEERRRLTTENAASGPGGIAALQVMRKRIRIGRFVTLDASLRTIVCG